MFNNLQSLYKNVRLVNLMAATFCSHIYIYTTVTLSVERGNLQKTTLFQVLKNSTNYPAPLQM